MRAAWSIDRKRAVRWAAPFAVTLLGALLSGGPAGEPSSFRPDLAAASAFASGLLFGWIGAAGAGLGAALGAAFHAAGTGPESGVPGWSVALLSGLGAGVAGAVPFAVFRHLRGLGRGLPNLRSYLWLLASGALAASVASFLRAGPLAGGSSLRVWFAAFDALVTVAYLAPAAVVATDLWARWWLAPLPGEVPARRSLDLVQPRRLETAGAFHETRVLTRPAPRLGWGFAVGLAVLLGVTAVAVPVSASVPAGGHWVLLLYLAPVFWAGNHYGLRGAVATSGLSAAVFLLGQAAWSALVADPLLEMTPVGLRAACVELALFGVIGAFVGTAREREQLLRTEVVHRNRLLRQDLLRVVQALTNAVEAKDVYTEGHLKRVSDYAVMVGERMGLAGHSLEMLFFASMLHDIGKIGVPEAILTKEGPLSLEESRIMQRHSEIGARILQDLDILRDAAPLVLHHQERYDGRRDGKYPGYPAGLAGDEIPLGSRIIAVVDAFDAMTTDRPYRKGFAPEEAIGELRREAGSQFDPRVVEVFAGILADHPWRVEDVA